MLRLWLTNTANSRVFNVGLPGARMKVIGGDSGRVEREELVSKVLLAPSERAVIDVLIDQPGQLTLEHRTPNRTYPLASISVAEEPAEPSLTDEFDDFALHRSWSRSGVSSRIGWRRHQTRSWPWLPKWMTPWLRRRSGADGLRMPYAS